SRVFITLNSDRSVAKVISHVYFENIVAKFD
ncbi:unnamed protein product, partial [Rotaria sp. Silwood1]